MDITDLLPLIIFGLVYLFGASAKKKAEEEKKKKGTPGQPAASPQRKQGLQSRLEEALREMQARAEVEKQGAPRTTGTSANRRYEGGDVENEINRMTSSTLYDREIFLSEEERRKEKERRSQKNEEFHSLMEEVPNETYHGHGFRDFQEGHGLQAAGERAVSYDDTTSGLGDFHEAHGLHYEEPLYSSKGRKGAPASRPVQESRTAPIFGSPADLRNGIILAEILGKPKALRSQHP